MTGLIALVGGDPFGPGNEWQADLVGASGTQTVTIVPTAAAFEQPGTLVAAAERWFGSIGLRTEVVDLLDRTHASLPDTVTALRDARCLFFAGPSSLHFRAVLKDTPALAAVNAAVAGGATLFAAGGAAAALCDPMVDQRGGAFTIGLGVVQGLAMVPDASTWSSEKLHRLANLAPRDAIVVAIDPSTALVIDADGTCRAVGDGSIQVSEGGVAGTVADLRVRR